MSNRNRRPKTYTREFQDTAIKLVMASNSKSIAEIARELDVPRQHLYRWVRAWKLEHEGVETPSLPGSAEDRLKKLEKRNRELELENEILKKAAAYFAKTLL